MSENVYPSQPKQNSGSGLIKWLLIIALLLILGIGGCVGMLIWGVSSFYGMVMQPPQDLVEFLKQDQQVIERLGEDIEIMSLADSGRFNSNISNNIAEVSFDIRGSRGRATVEGTLQKSADKWVPENIVVRFSDGTTKQYP